MANLSGVQINWREFLRWDFVAVVVLWVASFVAHAVGAPVASSVLATAAVVIFAFGNARYFDSANTSRYLLAGFLGLGIAVFAVSGGDWSAVSSIVSVAALVPMVWLYARSLRSRGARSRA